jgi:hypothetical protein
MEDELKQDIVDAFAMLPAWNAHIEAHASRCVVPIFRWLGRRPEVFGNGVLLRIDEQICLVSAAHVADAFTHAPGYFGAAGRPIPIIGPRFSSRVPQGASRESDITDLAVWFLDPDTVGDQFGGGAALSLDQLELSDHRMIVGDGLYVVIGYPVNWQPWESDRASVGVRQLWDFREEREPDDYVARTLDRRRNLFLHFERSDCYRDGRQVNGRRPNGLSGGAVWRLQGGGASPDRPLLAAIFTEWRRDEPAGFIATRASVLVEMIARAHRRPQLRAS